MTTINGRTPEEIKQGLECQDCRNCTYDGRNFKDGESRCHEAADNAVALIDKLLECKKQLECERDEARNDLDTINYANTELHSAYEAMKRERDAVVEVLKHFECSSCIHENIGAEDEPCVNCTHNYAFGLKGQRADNWQWRGVQEVK